MKKVGLKKGDIIIFAVVLVVAAVSLLCFKVFSPAGDTAVISVDGNIAARLALNDNTEYDVVIDGKVTNTVAVDGGSVFVVSADCPDKICRNHRPISKKGDSIICLPNKVVITVETADEGNEIDGVVR